MWSLEIVMLPQVMTMTVMMTRPPRRRLLQALPFKRSLLSLTHHHVSWLRPLRYKLDELIDIKRREPTKDELIDMLEDVKEHFDIKRRECKDLRKELKALKEAFDKLNASHERIEKAHEKLGKPHKKLEKAHSSLLNEQNEKEHVTKA
jgi:predicted nuclease with TOPRIM domain